MYQSCIDAPEADLLALQEIVRGFSVWDTVTRVVEVGSWVGNSAIRMANTGNVEVHCIDTWSGSPNDATGPTARAAGRDELLRMFCRNCEDLLFTRIFPHVGTSEFWASVWPWQADVVFIDADHDYEPTRRDIELWTPHVRSGGILCGHDFHPNFPGVQRAVGATGPYHLSGERIWWREIK